MRVSHNSIRCAFGLLVLGLLPGCPRTIRGGDDADVPMEDGEMPPMDGGTLLPDGTEPFVESMTYPGEGNACRFTVQCGMRQLCVDDECIRHERVSADELTVGAWRRLTGAEWDASPINPGEGHLPWSTFDLHDYHGSGPYEALYGPTAWMVPGVDGPQLLVSLWHRSECQVLVVGATYRVLTVPGLMCSAATASVDGRVAIAGARASDGVNEIMVFDRNDELVFRNAIPDALNARVSRSENWGAGAQVGLVSSLYFWGDGLVASAARGTDVVAVNMFRSNTRIDWNGLVFLDVTADGAMTIRRVAGKEVVDGWKGWLADDHGSLVAFVNRRTGRQETNPLADAELAVLSLESGERRPLVDRWAYDGRYFQPRQGYWVYQVDGAPICHYSRFDSDGVDEQIRISNVWPFCEEPDAGQRGRGRVLETPWSMHSIDPSHKDLGYIRVGTAAKDGIEGVSIVQYFSVERPVASGILPPRSSMLSVSGTTAYSRYGKSREILSISPGDTQYLVWIEAQLSRSNGAMP